MVWWRRRLTGNGDDRRGRSYGVVAAGFSGGKVFQNRTAAGFDWWRYWWLGVPGLR